MFAERRSEFALQDLGADAKRPGVQGVGAPPAPCTFSPHLGTHLVESPGALATAQPPAPAEMRVSFRSRGPSQGETQCLSQTPAHSTFTLSGLKWLGTETGPSDLGKNRVLDALSALTPPLALGWACDPDQYTQ